MAIVFLSRWLLLVLARRLESEKRQTADHRGFSKFQGTMFNDDDD